LRSSIVFLLSICLFAEAIINSLVGIVTRPSTATVLYTLEAEVVIDIIAGIGAVLYWFSSKPDYSASVRPLGVTLIAAFIVLSGVLLVGEGLVLLLLPIIGLLGVAIGALGVGFFKLGKDLWDGKEWALQVMQVLSVIGIIVSLALLPFYPNYGAPILALFQFWYLRRPHVHNYFQQYDLKNSIGGSSGFTRVLGQSLPNKDGVMLIDPPFQ
jgi:hypothetical protein